MQRVIIWGTGLYGEYALEDLNYDFCKVVAVVDSDVSKHNKKWHGYTVLSFENAIKLEFDYILIAIKNNDEIVGECIIKGYEEKIVIYGKETNCKWLYSAHIKSKEGKEHLGKEIYFLKKKLEKKELEYKNYEYEHGLNKIIINDAISLLQMIIANRNSLVRFGDGEIQIINNEERPWFQKVNAQLSSRLKQIINAEKQGLIVSVADDFGSLEKYNDEAKYHIRHYVTNHRAEALKVLNSNKVYYDAYVSRPYLMYKDKNYSKTIFELWKKVWEGRNVLLVEGPYIRNGVGNDLFVNTNSIRRIICPAQNAFDKYDEILTAVEQYAKKDDLVLISLGPTATVLAYDLFEAGFQAIDFGQLDNEYEWFLMEATTRVPIPGKAVPEIPECRIPDECNDEKYISEIVIDFSK